MRTGFTVSKPVRSLVVLAAILAVLVSWERWLTVHRTEARSDSVRIGAVFDASILDQRPVAAMGLQSADGSLLYLFDRPGLWRLLEANGAPARPSEIDTILPRLAQGRGVIRSPDPDDPADYGIGTRNTLRLTLHGERVLEDTNRDRFYTIEIGDTVDATGGSYVRIGGAGAIWEVDFNLRDVLAADPRSSLPPMLDTGLIPEAWPGLRDGIGRIRIHRPDRPSIAIFVSETELPSDTRLLVAHGDERFPADRAQAGAYSTFLRRAGFLGILSPDERSELGFEDPLGEITLHSSTGDAMRLIFGRTLQSGNLPVFNSFTRVGYEVSGDLHDLFFPEVESLRGAGDGNPWRAWQRGSLARD